MSLNCIVGEAKLDKSKYIYDKAVSKEKDGKSVIIFVPSQARMIAEEEYILKTGKKGMLDTDITTLSRYISKFLDNNVGNDREYISDDEKRIYVRKIISENSQNLGIFSKVIDKPSFVDLILSYIDSFKKENIALEDIEKIETANRITKIKLEEIQKICMLVDEKLSGRYMDSLDMLDMFSSYINSYKEYFENKEIFFHGYNNFSKKELAVIKELISIGVDVNISLTLKKEYIDSRQCPDNMFEIPYKTYCDLEKLSRECGVSFNVITDIEKLDLREDIEYLIDNIFSNEYNSFKQKSDNVTLRLEKNLSYEIENIAKDIIDKTRKDTSLRWRDFAIYTNSFEDYEFCIKRIFDEYEINYHFDDSSYVGFSNFAIYTLNLLKLANDGIDINKLFILLKTGLFNVSTEDISYFENYTLEFGIKGYMLAKEFRKNNKVDITLDSVYDIYRLNNIREKIVCTLNEFSNSILSAKTAKEKVLVIYNHLIDNEVIKRYEDEINITTEENIKAGSLRRQVIDVIYEVFDNICKVTENQDILLDTFISLFEFGMQDRKIKTIPMTIDQVEICDINKTRITSKKYVYMIGAYENGLPSISAEDVVFSDRELNELKENHIGIKQNSLTRTNMALFNVYIALANVENHLTITMPVSKITGEPLSLGILMNEVKRILDLSLSGNIAKDDSFEIDENRMTKKSVFRTMLYNIQNADELDRENLSYLYGLYMHYMNSDEKYRKILEYSRKDMNLSEEVLNNLYGDKLNSSVSRLETFKKCPFSYYTSYILNIKSRKKYALSVMDMGTLMHDVLEKFSKWLMERSLLWQQVITDEKISLKAKDKVSEIIDRIFEDRYSKYKDNNRYIMLKSSLKRKMFKIIQIIATSFNQSQFKPLGYEIEFKEGALYSPIEVNLNNGKTMYLIGKIDRVDTAKIDDKVYVRIVDYKSSNKNISIKDIKEGISLQLMTYMSALINSKENISQDYEVLPAAINYFTLKADIKRLEEFSDDKDKINKELIKSMKLKGIYLSDVKVLENLDRKYKDSSSSFIDINNRNINDENKVIGEDKFKEECENIRKILKEIGREITEGVIKIKPKKINGKLPCEYCDYESICRKNIRA